MYANAKERPKKNKCVCVYTCTHTRKLTYTSVKDIYSELKAWT